MVKKSAWILITSALAALILFFISVSIFLMLKQNGSVQNNAKLVSESNKKEIRSSTRTIRVIENKKPEVEGVKVARATSTDFVSQSLSTSQVEASQKLGMLFVGDIMLDRNVAARSNKARSLEYPFARIKEIFKEYDVVIGNLEGPVTNKRRNPNKGEVDFMFDLKVPEMLKNLGFDAVSQANNHAWDQGEIGANESRANLQKAGLQVFGDQVNDNEELSLTFIESSGKKIALLGFSAFDHEIEKDKVQEIIQIAHAQVDLIIVFIHWGTEYQAKPNQKQVELAHWFIDNDVNVVIGAHSHWIQSVEVYKNKFIAYSLGNFICDQDWSVETNFGLILGLTIEQDKRELNLMPIKKM